MKTVAYYILFFLFLIILLPAFMIRGCFTSPRPEVKGPDVVSVYIVNEKKLVKMKLEDYLEGVVAAEMPVSFHIEALKAQAVAARTYTVLRMRALGGRGCEKHPGADVCTDSTHCQAWQSKNEQMQKWGVWGYFNMKKIARAVKQTEGLIMVYNNKPIDAIFHSTSGGKTENSEDVWQNYVPYLRSVVSKYENHSPKLISKNTVSVDLFLNKLKEKYPDIIIDKNSLASQMKVLERSEGGKVVRMQIGNKTIRGSEIRNMFGLNSSGFNWKVEGNKIRFTVIGYGHGVGMSQYGADGMAKKGYDFKKILTHYYTGVKIVKKEQVFPGIFKNQR